MQVSTTADAATDDLFAGLCESSLRAEAGGIERAEEEESEGNYADEGERSGRDERIGPTPKVNTRVSKDFSGERFQCGCFAVEWISSNIL